MLLELSHRCPPQEGVWSPSPSWGLRQGLTEEQKPIRTLSMVFKFSCKSEHNEKLLHSSGNPTQCSLVTEMGRKSTKEGLYVYVYMGFPGGSAMCIAICIADSLRYTVETIQHCKATIPPPPPPKKECYGKQISGHSSCQGRNNECVPMFCHWK